MKGIILAGGTGSRLWPLTDQVSKQMLPVGRVPMIFYPLNILIKAGVRDILIVASPQHGGNFINMLEPLLRPYGISISLSIQLVPAGLPEAFTIGASFIGTNPVTMILGDNIFEDTDIISNAIENFDTGGMVFVKKVEDPQRFGVATINNGRIIDISEKPTNPASNLAITGAYIYDSRVIEIARLLKKSDRGEFEIVEVHQRYLKDKMLRFCQLNGEWFDAGTIDSYHRANSIALQKKFFENFDPILIKTIENGYKHNKAFLQAQLRASF